MDFLKFAQEKQDDFLKDLNTLVSIEINTRFIQKKLKMRLLVRNAEKRWMRCWKWENVMVL